MDEAQVVSPYSLSAKNAAPIQGADVERRAIRKHFLDKMDSEIAKSFSEPQLQELERLLTTFTPSQSPIDIRITVPLPWRHCFITVLAGPERRSAERLMSERQRHPAPNRNEWAAQGRDDRRYSGHRHLP